MLLFSFRGIWSLSINSNHGDKCRYLSDFTFFLGEDGHTLLFCENWQEKQAGFPEILLNTFYSPMI